MWLYAYAARYGHQQLDGMMGRTPTALELHVFVHLLQELREAEPPLLGGMTAEGASEP